jgi:GNAT superfamily N-acetyltransferase
MAGTVVAFEPGLAPYFESLNREWIERWFAVEPKDEHYLRDPHGSVIEPGGAVFFVVEAGVPVGVVAAIRYDADTFELAKMAVTPRCQGRGYGRALGEAVVRFAADAGARRVVVLSDSRLTAAVRLYERLGFRHQPPPADTGYARGDVYMELDLVPGGPARG